jgi:DNA-binding transcriptional ArsR family regulator
MTSTEPTKPELQSTLTTLALHAEKLIKNERERDWLPMMRNQAFHAGIHEDVKDADLQAYLDAAERRLHQGTFYRAGDKLQASESVFLLDGLIKLGEANMVVGQPKVGKSSFSTGLIAALRDKKETFLGRDLMLPGTPMPVLIFGTDQSEGDWLHLLRRENIVDETQALNLDFFCSMETGEEFNFTKDGLRHMKTEIEKHQFPLVIIDSLSSMMEPTGIEENTSRYAQPIRKAIATLRDTGATLLVIHHSVKRPNTWDWITECRGSSSISSVFSWGFLMRWVAQEEDGLARTDRRVGFSGKGRGSNSSGGVMGEYLEEGGWTFLDGLEAAQQVEKTGQRIMELGGIRAQVFDELTVKHDMNVDVAADELASHMNKHTSAIQRELRTLTTKGLASVSRKQGKKAFYELSESAKSWWDHSSLRDSERVFSVISVPFSEKNKKNIYNNSQDSTAELPTEEKKTIPPRTPVEVNRNGSWSNGWVVRDGSNLDKIIVEKIGTPNVTMGTQYQDPLRWDIDVRPCQSAFTSTPDPLDF